MHAFAKGVNLNMIGLCGTCVCVYGLTYRLQLAICTNGEYQRFLCSFPHSLLVFAYEVEMCIAQPYSARTLFTHTSEWCKERCICITMDWFICSICTHTHSAYDAIYVCIIHPTQLLLSIISLATRIACITSSLLQFFNSN